MTGRLDGPPQERGDWLTVLLEDEAGQYEPDGRRIRGMLDERLEDLVGGAGGARHGRARGHGSAARLRLAGIPAGIAAAALSATVAVAVTVTVTSSRPSPQASDSAVGGIGLPAASESAPAASTQPSARSTQSTVTTGATDSVGTIGGVGTTAGTSTTPASGGHSVSSAPSASAPAPGSQPSNTAANFVAATGSLGSNSNASFTEEDVNITLAEPATALQLVVNVAPSPGLMFTQVWSNRDITMFDKTVDTSSGGIVCTLTLKSGYTLAAGTFTIAVDFQHSAGHDVTADTFALNATSDQAHGSAPGSARGGF